MNKELSPNPCIAYINSVIEKRREEAVQVYNESDGHDEEAFTCIQYYNELCENPTAKESKDDEWLWI